MATGNFDPNRNVFSTCLERLNKVVESQGLRTRDRILTSRDKDVARAMDALEVDNIPDDFTKWQLPVYLDGPSHMFVTVAQPNAKVPSHCHKEGAGIRFIAGGSINYEGKELSAGDWMYIPAGVDYKFEVGRFGATMCYCYQCCCA